MHAGTLCRRPARIAITAAMLSLLLIGGCALPRLADPEIAKYRRIDARLRAEDEYEALRRACRARGGAVYVSANPSRLRSTVSDLTTARCVTPHSGLSF